MLNKQHAKVLPDLHDPMKKTPKQDHTAPDQVRSLFPPEQRG